MLSPAEVRETLHPISIVYKTKMAAISSKMSSSPVYGRVRFTGSLTGHIVFLLVAAILAVSCRTSRAALAVPMGTSSPASSSSSSDDQPDRLEPGFLFRKLMQEYSRVKTPLILCSLSSALNADDGVGDGSARHHQLAPGGGAGAAAAAGGSSADAGALRSAAPPSVLTRCRTGAETSFDSLSVDSLMDSRIGGRVAVRCGPTRRRGTLAVGSRSRAGPVPGQGQGQSQSLAQCLAGDGAVEAVLSGKFVDGLMPGMLRTCCLLNGCGFGPEAGAAWLDREARSGTNECLGCLATDNGKGSFHSKTASTDPAFLLHSLSKMFCSDRKYNNIPCTKLNLIALNVLTGTAPKMILEGAADILRHCYPSFPSESLRLFQMIVGNMSANDTSRIKALLAPPPAQEVQPSTVMQFFSGESSVKRERMSDLTARAKTGLVVMGILVVVSILLGAWVVYQRARAYLRPNEAVRYSQISINDIYIDDAAQDDEDEDDGDPGAGVPTPYRP